MTVTQEQSCVDFGETNTRRPRGPFPSAPFCQASDLPVGVAYISDDFVIKPGLMRNRMPRLRMACQISAVVVACGMGDCLKTTLAFYQPGVSAGLYEGGGFLSKTHD